MIHKIKPEKLSNEAFTSYGDVIEPKGDYKTINNGLSKKWNKLINPYISTEKDQGINLGILRTKIGDTTFTDMERHIFTSQIFLPLNSKRFLVVVAPPANNINVDYIRAFVGDNNQGVCLRPRTWHCPIIPLDESMDFVSIMRYSNDSDIEKLLLDKEINI